MSVRIQRLQRQSGMGLSTGERLRTARRSGASGVMYAAAWLWLALLVLCAPVWAEQAAVADPIPQVAAGRIERMALFPSTQVAPRHVDVWLPPDYPASGRYAVLYMHDGQMLFDAQTTWNKQEWQVDETAARLIAAGTVQPFIVVGVWNGGAGRHSEYFPQKPFASLSRKQRRETLALEREPGTPLFDGPVRSDAYLRFLVEELKPEIDRRYATRTERASTVVMGSSMGGLISMYALAEYPRVFGGAACLSTHWPGTFSRENNPIPPAFLDYLRSRFPEAGEHRIWFDHGTLTLDAWYPELQVQVDKVMRAKGYGLQDWRTRIYEGADHSELAWSARLAEPLTFLLGTPETAP